jgi:hypothetical protein
LEADNWSMRLTEPPKKEISSLSLIGMAFILLYTQVIDTLIMTGIFSFISTFIDHADRLFAFLDSRNCSVKRSLTTRPGRDH